MALSYEFHVPIIISSAGGDGTDAYVDEFLDIIKQIVDNNKNKYTLPSVHLTAYADTS